MCLKPPRLRRSDCSVGRSTSMSSFTRVATGPRLPHPARSSRESAAPLVLAILAMFCAPEPVRWEMRGRWTGASARLPGRPSARRATRARTLTSRSPFERPNAGGTRARPRARHPHPKDSLPHSRERSQPAGWHLTVGGCPRPYLAHRPRGVLVSPGAPPGVPVSSRAKSLSVQPTPLATVASTTHWRRRRASRPYRF